MSYLQKIFSNAIGREKSCFAVKLYAHNHHDPFVVLLGTVVSHDPSRMPEFIAVYIKFTSMQHFTIFAKLG